jgi:hypothetical protein
VTNSSADDIAVNHHFSRGRLRQYFVLCAFRRVGIGGTDAVFLRPSPKFQNDREDARGIFFKIFRRRDNIQNPHDRFQPEVGHIFHIVGERRVLLSGPAYGKFHADTEKSVRGFNKRRSLQDNRDGSREKFQADIIFRLSGHCSNCNQTDVARHRLAVRDGYIPKNLREYRTGQKNGWLNNLEQPLISWNYPGRCYNSKINIKSWRDNAENTGRQLAARRGENLYIPFYGKSGAGKFWRGIMAAVLLFSIGMTESVANGENIAPGQEETATGPEAERAYFAEEGVTYGGYLFAQLGRRIVKIPLNKDKINGNAQLVMDFPDDEYYDGGYLSVDGGSLYINFMAYMTHGGLYRLTSPDAKPEFVLKNGDGNGGFGIIGSNLRPDELKFFTFSEYDAGEHWGTLYCYFPARILRKRWRISREK